MEETYGQFIARTTSCKGKKKKISGSWGIYDYYKYYRKNRPKDKKYVLNEHQYFSLVRKVNNILAQGLIDGDTLEFPYALGEVYSKRRKARTTFKDGKVVTNRRIDWNETLKLWHTDEEAHKKKVLIRRTEPYINYMDYTKRLAKYKNMRFYSFRINKYLLTDFTRKHSQSAVNAVFSSIKDFEDIKNLYNG